MSQKRVSERRKRPSKDERLECGVQRSWVRRWLLSADVACEKNVTSLSRKGFTALMTGMAGSVCLCCPLNI